MARVDTESLWSDVTPVYGTPVMRHPSGINWQDPEICRAVAELEAASKRYGEIGERAKKVALQITQTFGLDRPDPRSPK